MLQTNARFGLFHLLGENYLLLLLRRNPFNLILLEPVNPEPLAQT